MRKPLISLLTALAALALTASVLPADAAAPRGWVRLFTPSPHATMTVYTGDEGTWTEFNAPLYFKARGTRFEIDVRRTAWNRPLQAVVHLGGTTRAIPARYLNGWQGLRRAFVYTWKRPDGTTIARRAADWCPNNDQGSRLDPNAATETAFTYGCGYNPFTRGMRWGVDRGWARQVLGYNTPVPSTGLGDHVVLEVSLRKALAQIFGISEAGRTVRFDVTVKHVAQQPGEEAAPTPAPDGVASAATASRNLAPARPTTETRTPPRSSLPDLIALPSWGISTHSASGKDFLDFAATVYNGGQGPLVVEGFRRGARRVMDAYQSFYRGEKVVGHDRVGTMEYDSRSTHQHWHFEDFAKYDLVDARHRRVKGSGKEAFCLAPTDAIDLLVKGAAVNPGNGDLGTACGDLSSIWVREVLASGWGDTYSQQRAGQSINITGLRNGTYWIRVTANPDGRLSELSHRNNVAFRRVVLGGTPGHRTVRVPRLGLIDSEAGYSGER